MFYLDIVNAFNSAVFNAAESLAGCEISLESFDDSSTAEITDFDADADNMPETNAAGADNTSNNRTENIYNYITQNTIGSSAKYITDTYTNAQLSNAYNNIYNNAHNNAYSSTHSSTYSDMYSSIFGGLSNENFIFGGTGGIENTNAVNMSCCGAAGGQSTDGDFFHSLFNSDSTENNVHNTADNSQNDFNIFDFANTAESYGSYPHTVLFGGNTESSISSTNSANSTNGISSISGTDRYYSTAGKFVLPFVTSVGSTPAYVGTDSTAYLFDGGNIYGFSPNDYDLFGGSANTYVGSAYTCVGGADIYIGGSTNAYGGSTQICRDGGKYMSVFSNTAGGEYVSSAFSFGGNEYGGDLCLSGSQNKAIYINAGSDVSDSRKNVFADSDYYSVCIGGSDYGGTAFADCFGSSSYADLSQNNGSTDAQLYNYTDYAAGESKYEYSDILKEKAETNNYSNTGGSFSINMGGITQNITNSTDAADIMDTLVESLRKGLYGCGMGVVY